MKTSTFFIVASVALTGVLPVTSARADDQNFQYTERHELRHHDNRPSGHSSFVFTSSENYHEQPIAMPAGPPCPNPYYSGATFGFTFGFGPPPAPRPQVRHHPH